MTTIAVVGHCQSDVMADCLGILAPDVTVRACPVYSPLVAGSDEHARWYAAIDEVDLIITQLVDDRARDFGLPQPQEMVRPGRNVLTWPVIAFKGLQPDCTYVFQDGQALAAAMGPYHSAIAVAAFLEGLDRERTIGLFNALTYGALGYFDEFEAAADVLSRAAARSGLDVSAFLQAPRTCFTHTFNHPKVEIIHALAVQLLRLADIEPQSMDARPLDRLAAGPIWPVYPEIARRLGVEPDPDFRLGDSRMDLPTVIASTFDALASHQDAHGAIVLDQNRPMATPVIERAQAFIRAHVIGR